MRFLIGADVAPDPDSGASGTVYHTIRALRTLGHEVDEIWRDHLPHRIRHGNLHYLLELPRGLRDEVRRRTSGKDYDVILLSQPHAWLAARDHLRNRRRGIFLNRSHGLETLYDGAMKKAHRQLGIPENRFPRFLATMALRRLLDRHVRLAAKYSQGLVVPASDIGAYMTRVLRCASERVAVIHHGVPDAYLERPLRPMTPDRLRRLLYVGQYALVKGPHVLAAALEEILPERPDVSMTWVCDRSHHDAISALLPTTLRERVQLVEWRSQESLLELYDSHGVFLFPSFYEGAGKACIEAMSRGLCVVAADVGGMRDYIVDGRNGRRVAPGDARGTAAAVRWLQNDAARAAACAAEAAATARPMTWRRCAERIAEFAVRVKELPR